jgi:hypothetical protein
LSQKLLGEYLLKISQHFDFQQFVCKSDEGTVQYKMEVGCQIYADKFRKMQLQCRHAGEHVHAS